jgi:hypothetical protein
MNLSLEEVARLLAAMKFYSVPGSPASRMLEDPDDLALIERLEYRLSVMEAEQARKESL